MVGGSGQTVIGAVLALLIFALLAAVAVSVVTTVSSIGYQEELGVKSLYIAQGGLEFALKNGTTPCGFDVSSPRALGGGTFTVSTRCIDSGSGCLAPATVADDPLSDSATTVNVTSTADYTIPGTLKVESEYIFCLNAAAAQFTDCTRGAAGSTAAAHSLGTELTQCTVTSTGTYSAGVFFGDVRRSVRANVGE